MHLSKVASKRVGSATLESKTRQVRRFFSNQQVDPQCCYEPVAELLLKRAIASGSPIRVLVDTLELSGERQVLMAALAHRRRALPVCWQVRRRTGVSDAEQQISLFETLSTQIDEACDGACDDVPEVIVIEDGGFHLNRSRLYQPERLSRLVMALAWTYVWLMHVGVWAVKRGFRRLVDRADRRDRSYPEIGRRYLQRCMTNGKPIHIGLKPYF